MSTMSTNKDGWVDAPPASAVARRPQFDYGAWIGEIRANPGQWRKLPHTMQHSQAVRTLVNRYPDIEFRLDRVYDPEAKNPEYEVYARLKP